MFRRAKKTKKWWGTSKKIIASLLIILFSFSFFPKSALAEFNWAAPPDAASQALDGVFAKYRAKTNTALEMVDKMNNLQLKTQAPQLSIIFSPTNPNPGEKVTATAMPMYFGNKNGDSMYYTWYLRHREEKDEAKTVSNLEKYKVRAMRIIASDGYEDPAKYGDRSKYVPNSGYQAVFGGDDQKEKRNHCFFYNVTLGAEYEFPDCRHLFPNSPTGTTGDGAFTFEDEEFWKTNPTSPDTAGRGHTDEANVAGLGAKAFTWTYQEGDEIGVAIEGISIEPTSYEDSSYKIMWALTKNKCDAEDKDFRDPKEVNGTTVTVEPAEWPSCPGGCTFPRTVTITKRDNQMAPSSSYAIQTATTVVKKESIIIHPQQSSVSGSGSGNSESFSMEIGTTRTVLPTKPDSSACYETDKDVFAYLPKDKNGKPDTPFQYITDDSKMKEVLTNSGATDQSCCPADRSTGDTPACSVLSKEGSSSPAEMSVDKDNNLFKMTMEDFNKCLLQNFTNPTDSETGAGGGGSDKKLDVSISYSPKNPTNVPMPTGNDPDTFAINADEIDIESEVNNATNSDFLTYTWDVYATGAEEIKDDTDWGDPIPKSDLNGSGQTMGMGIKSLKFNSRFPDGVTFIKVNLAVSENAYNGERTGHSDVIIPISSSQNTLNVYSASISNDANLTLGLGSQKCLTNGQNDPVCEVAKNQILAVQAAVSGLKDFVWTIDGKNIDNYNGESSSINPTYFPVTKEVGETFNVSLAATDSDGKKINLTRAFKVIDPKISVTSTDTTACTPVLKGFYVDNDDVSWPDYSDTEFETLNGATIKLRADFVGATPPENQITWSVDNIPQSAGSTFSYAATKAVGENYAITVNGLYSQDNATAKALLKYWGINYNGLYEKNSSATINIKTVGSLSDTTAKGNVKKFLAAMAIGVPAYLSFLFRIILTTALMLFTYRVIFTLLPNAKREEI